MKKGIFFFIILLMSSCSDYPTIKEAPAFTLGTVVDTWEGRGFTLIYTYKVRDRIFKKNGSSVFYKCEYKFKGKKFLVVYNREEPKISMLLVRPEDYLKWNLVYPDSLKWVFYCTRGSFGPREFEEWKIEYLQPPYL